MATTKRLSSSYTVHTINGDAITLDTRSDVNDNASSSDIWVYGNLHVSGDTILGNVTDVSSTNLAVEDNVITLNKGETGPGVTQGQAGVEVDRGTQPTVALRWFEPYQKWQITVDGSIYANIATSVSGSYLTAVIEDLDPHLGGNLNVNGFSIVSTVPDQNISFNAPLQFLTQSTAPTIQANNTLLYAALSTGGGTGLYISNTEFANRELISKKKALAYSIIF